MAGEPKGNDSTGNGTIRSRSELFTRMFLESPTAMRKFLMLLAKNAGRAVPTAEICDELDLTPAQLAGVLGAFGRRRKNRYKDAQRPFAAQWDGGQHTWTYRMDEGTADIIKTAAKDLGE